MIYTPVVLKTSSGSEVFGLGALVLPHENVPLLCTKGVESDGEGHTAVGCQVLDGQVQVLIGEDAAEVGGQRHHGDRVNASDGQGGVGTGAHGRGVDLEFNDIC